MFSKKALLALDCGQVRDLKHRARGILFSTLLLFFLLSGAAAGEPELDPASIVRRMESAYAGVNDYQTEVEVKDFQSNGSVESQRFLYTFRKPEKIRLDFESPHKGMVLIYPDRNGKVFVRGSGWARLFPLHLSLDNRLLATSPGQRIDQTDMGLLIRNIGRSMTEGRRGSIELKDDNGYIRIGVLAADHFRKGVITQYLFVIDRNRWLPVHVEESTPDGRLERAVTFSHLRINPGIAEDFFQTEAQDSGVEERSGRK